MTSQTVTIRVPAAPDHLALLRQAVWTLAARQHFTLDQMDDLRMAVEEAAAQLLRHASGDAIQLDAMITDEGLEVRLETAVSGSAAVVDETSFAWQILRALADDLQVSGGDGRACIVLTKRRVVDVPADESAASLDRA